MQGAISGRALHQVALAGRHLHPLAGEQVEQLSRLLRQFAHRLVAHRVDARSNGQLQTGAPLFVLLGGDETVDHLLKAHQLQLAALVEQLCRLAELLRSRAGVGVCDVFGGFR